MANEDNKGIVAGSQDMTAGETGPSEHVDEGLLHDWEMIHCSSEGWDEPSMFRCTKCGELRVSGTYEVPKAEGCPVGVDPQNPGLGQAGGVSEAVRNAALAEGGRLSASTAARALEQRLAKWDARSALDILERYERGQLLTREDADVAIQAVLADVLPADAEGRLLKPGDRARIVGDDGAIVEFTVFAVGRSTVITDAGGSYPAGRCRYSGAV